MERGQPGLYRRPIHRHVSAPYQATDRVGNIGCGYLVASTKHPHKFTENRNWHSDEIGLCQDLCRSPSLMKVVLNRGANEYVAIGGNFHFTFAHPWLAISLISSIVNFGPRRCARQPKKSAMAPSCVIALTTIRPSGNLSASTFSPGLTP